MGVGTSTVQSQGTGANEDTVNGALLSRATELLAAASIDQIKLGTGSHIGDIDYHYRFYTLGDGTADQIRVTQTTSNLGGSSTSYSVTVGDRCISTGETAQALFNDLEVRNRAEFSSKNGEAQRLLADLGQNPTSHGLTWTKENGADIFSATEGGLRLEVRRLRTSALGLEIDTFSAEISGEYRGENIRHRAEGDVAAKIFEYAKTSLN